MARLAAGRIIANRYALKTSLGRGGTGVVWDAYDLLLGREVAVKEVVPPPTLPDTERRSAQARVLREARAAARLNHPGAVTIYDVLQDRGGTFIVMELVRAPTLAELVQAEGPLPAERVAEIGAQVASTLAATRHGAVGRQPAAVAGAGPGAIPHRPPAGDGCPSSRRGAAAKRARPAADGRPAGRLAGQRHRRRAGPGSRRPGHDPARHRRDRDDRAGGGHHRGACDHARAHDRDHRRSPGRAPGRMAGLHQ